MIQSETEIFLFAFLFAFLSKVIEKILRKNRAQNSIIFLNGGTIFLLRKSVQKYMEKNTPYHLH